MNRNDLQELAQVRIGEAELLAAQGRWDGAYYLAGYAVECALKACFAKSVNQHDFPDKQRVLAVYQHDLTNLLRVSGVEGDLMSDSVSDPALRSNWETVRTWSEHSRYTRWSQAQAEVLLTAITDPAHGVLPWITRHW